MSNTPATKTETDVNLDIENEVDLDDLELIHIQLEQGRLVDRYGHSHSESVFDNWSPGAIKALGIHRVKDDEGAE